MLVPWIFMCIKDAIECELRLGVITNLYEVFENLVQCFLVNSRCHCLIWDTLLCCLSWSSPAWTFRGSLGLLPHEPSLGHVFPLLSMLVWSFVTWFCAGYSLAIGVGLLANFRILKAVLACLQVLKSLRRLMMHSLGFVRPFAPPCPKNLSFFHLSTL